MPPRLRFAVRPVFALLTALALGIAVGSVLAVPVLVLLTAMTVLFALSQFLMWHRRRTAISAFSLLLAFFLFGVIRGEQATSIARDDVSRLAGGPSVWVCGTVASTVESKPPRFGGVRSYSFALRVRGVNDYRRRQTASGWLQVAVFSSPTPPRTGDLLWLRGKIEKPPTATNPDGFDYRDYLRRQGIYATLAVRRDGDMRCRGHIPLPPVMQAAAGIRNAVEQRVLAHLPPNDAALLLGILLSERSRLPADVVDAFTRTGTVHILSVSGMHVAVIAALLLWAFQKLTVPRKAAYALCIVAVWLFALAASGGGGNPPAFRAALCATLFFAAPLLRRNTEPRHSLAFAALVLLLMDPLTLFDPGAQLSFAMVGTILLWNPLMERIFYPWEPGTAGFARFSRGTIATISLGIVAHLGSWPLVAFYFHQFSVVAPLANLPISFIADALVVGGLVFSAVPFLPWWVIAQGLSLLREVALVFAAPSWAAFSVAALPAPLIFVYYALVGGLAAVVRTYFLTPRRLFTPTALSASVAADTVNTDDSVNSVRGSPLPRSPHTETPNRA